MFIENKLGRHVMFKFVSVMASSVPLKNTDCLKALLPYVRRSSLMAGVDCRSVIWKKAFD